MPTRLLQLAEHSLNSNRDTFRIDIDICPRYVKHSSHFLDIIWNLESVNITWRLVCVTTLSRPPRMFEVVPAALEHCRMDGAGVAVAREDAGLPDMEDVDKIATRHRKRKWAETHVGCLWDPQALAASHRLYTRVSEIYETKSGLLLKILATS